MNKVRFQAALMAAVMMMSMLLGGCGSSKKKKAVKGAAKNAEAMLDDFCAYIKSGKYDKIDKMVDGKSDELETLKGYRDSEIKDLLEASRKRISFSVENVTADEKKEEGEATIVFTYFDVDDVTKTVDEDSSIRDAKKAIEDAKEIELEYDVELTLEKDWMITSSSVDTIVEDMFSFLEDLHFETQPTKATTRKTPLTEFSTAWYDDKFNEVQGYHQSTDFIRLIVTFWENCYDETITYEFYDGSTLLYSGSVVATNGVDYVYCDFEPNGNLPVDWISCDVYDSNHTLITVACVRIYGDDEVIPMPIYALGCDMIDKDGNVVPGYHEGDETISARVTLSESQDDAYLNYEYHRRDSTTYSDELMYQGSATMTSEKVILPFYGTDAATAGDYYVIVYDMEYNQLWETEFKIIPKDTEFEMDSQNVDIWYTYWADAASGDLLISVDNIPKGATAITYVFEANDYYNYMCLTYEVSDGTGKKIQEGTCSIVHNYEGSILVDLSNMNGGPLEMKLYAPSGDLVRTDTIEEE